MKNRLSSRLRLTLSGVTLLTLLLMCALVFAGMYFQTTADNREQLRQQAVQLSSYLDASDDPVSLLHGSVFTQRVTYLDTDGTVLYDSEVDASRLESHAGREEFQQARENGEAFTARSSATLGQTSLYYAKRLADGRVIRVSGTQRGMLRQVRDLLGYLLLGAVLCFGAAMAFSRPLAKRLAAPMNEVNLDQPLESDVYEELSPMLRRMAQQNARIADQMASLTAQRHELDTVLGGMKEGFVILDEKRHVLTMNNAARAMFCITNDPVGQPMIAVSRDEALLRLLDGQGTECAMQLNGMTIHLSRSHVEGGGTALLIYLALINLTTFIIYGADKRRARQGKWRVPEKTLFLLPLLGGSVGALLGMRVFHHKTKHWYFVWGVPAILLAQLALAVWLLTR